MTPDDLRRVRVSGGELSVLDVGDVEDPVVLLLHGFPFSSYGWRHLVPLLSPYLRIVAPDLLGAGDSDQPDGPDLGLRAQTGYVRELLEILGVTSSFAAVGSGLGGGIAQLLGLEGRASALVLLGPVAFDAWPGPWAREAQGSGDPGARLEEALRRGVAQEGRLTEDDLAAYRRPYEGHDGEAAFVRFLGGLDGVGLEDAEAGLAALEIPAMVLWGEEDAFCPPELADRFADVLQMGSVALLPGCGHLVLEDAPETVGPLIFEFLRSRYLGAPHTHTGGPVAVELGRRPPDKEDG